MLSQHILPDAPAYTRRCSDSKCIPCDWKLEDNYERVTVFSKKSDVHWAGDGLFARRDLPKGGFHLLDLIITELKSHMTCYNSMLLINWLKLQHSDWRANLVKDLFDK